MKLLKKTKIQNNVDKYNFYVQKMKFFSFIISNKRFEIDSVKVTSIFNKAQPTFLCYVRLFLGFGNFNQCFIENLSELDKFHTNITKKQVFWMIITLSSFF